MSVSVENQVKSDDAVGHNDEAKNGDPNFECDDGCRKEHESIKKLRTKSCVPDIKLSSSHVHGRVKWFDARKEYGFITRADTGEDVFLHASGILAIRPGKYLRDVGKDEVSLFIVCGYDHTNNIKI